MNPEVRLTVFLIGLGLVALADKLHQPWRIKADALAALSFAGIVICVSVQLGRKTIDDLADGFKESQDALPP